MTRKKHEEEAAAATRAAAAKMREKKARRRRMKCCVKAIESGERLSLNSPDGKPRSEKRLSHISAQEFITLVKSFTIHLAGWGIPFKREVTKL